MQGSGGGPKLAEEAGRNWQGRRAETGRGGGPKLAAATGRNRQRRQAETGRGDGPKEVRGKPTEVSIRVPWGRSPSGMGKVTGRNGEGLFFRGGPSPPKCHSSHLYGRFLGEGPSHKKRPSPNTLTTFPKRPRAVPRPSQTFRPTFPKRPRPSQTSRPPPSPRPPVPPSADLRRTSQTSGPRPKLPDHRPPIAQRVSSTPVTIRHETRSRPQEGVFRTKIWKSRRERRNL